MYCFTEQLTLIVPWLFAAINTFDSWESKQRNEGISEHWLKVQNNIRLSGMFGLNFPGHSKLKNSLCVSVLLYVLKNIDILFLRNLRKDEKGN